MLRRAFHVVLLAFGGLPAAWALRTLPEDPRRALVTLGLVLVATGLSLSGLVGRARVAPWLRGLALGVALVSLAGVAGVWYHLSYQTLPAIPRESTALRQTVQSGARHLTVVAGTLIYATLCLAVLPVRQPTAIVMQKGPSPESNPPG